MLLLERYKMQKFIFTIITSAFLSHIIVGMMISINFVIVCIIIIIIVVVIVVISIGVVSIIDIALAIVTFHHHHQRNMGTKNPPDFGAN